MKYIFTILSLYCLINPCIAQDTTTVKTIETPQQNNAAKVAETVDDNYDRISLSVVLVNHNDAYDNQVSQYFSSVEWGDKFDHNIIPTLTINTSLPRTYDKSTSGDRTSSIAKTIEQTPFGKEIIEYVYGRQDDGTMTDGIIKYRGNYNATDQDLIAAQATKVGAAALADQGFKLVTNSYLLVIDYANIEITDDSKGKPVYSAKPNAFLYKLTYNEQTQAQLFNTWIYAEDSAADKAKKRKMFDELTFNVESVANVSASVTTSDETGAMAGLIKSGYEEIIYHLEKKVDKMQVRTPVVAVKPIRAKIGLKEGLKNGSRYFGYKFKLANDGVTIKPIKTGVVRATTIADNRTITDGTTQTSEFYQIAGQTVKEGQLIKQKNDLGLGVALGYQIMGFPGVHISIDKLINIRTSGMAMYGFVDATINPYLPKDLASKQGVQLALTPDVLLGANVMVGFGVGFHFARILEIQPQVTIGMDMLMQPTDYKLEQISSTKTGDAEFTDKIAYSASIGAKLFCNIAYPLQAYVGVNYSMKFSEGILYQFYYQEVLQHLKQQRGGFGINVGLKFIF